MLSEEDTVYLTNLEIRGLKLIRKLELDLLTDEGQPRMWTVLVGRNGRGKTSVLQAIALAAAGIGDASELAGPIIDSYFDRRSSERAVEIDGEFVFEPVHRDGANRHHPISILPGSRYRPQLRSELCLRRGRNRFEGGALYSDDGSASDDARLDPLVEARASNLPWWFTAGYGVHRRLHTPEHVRQPARKNQDRLRSLFEPSPLVGIGFADLFPDDISRKFSKMLRDALTMSRQTVPDIRGVTLTGRGGIKSMADLATKDKFELTAGSEQLKMPATWLSHGYQSSLAWIADLIGQYFLDVETNVGDDPTTSDIQGLVLIDELDLFLHPDWQVHFIEALRETFPNVQFVVTTHSPLLIANMRPEEIVLLEYTDDGDIEQRELPGDPRLMTTSDLYRQIFDVEDTPPSELAHQLSRYNYLTRNGERTREERDEVSRLRQQLQEAGIRGLDAR